MCLAVDGQNADCLHWYAVDGTLLMAYCLLLLMVTSERSLAVDSLDTLLQLLL